MSCFKLKVVVHLLKIVTSYFLALKKIELEPIPEPVIRSGDDGQRMLYFDSCQMNFIRMASFLMNGLLTGSVSNTFQSGL